MSYRYRDHSGGITVRSTKRMKRNIAKVGTPVKIRGYRFTSTRTYKHDDGSTYDVTTNHEAVMVYGTKGTARLEGYCWSYLGCGPRGLYDMLVRLKVDRVLANRIAYETPRLDKDGTDWEIERVSCALGKYWRLND